MATQLSNPTTPSTLFAAVDMGTNSFKMTIVQAQPNGRFLSINRIKEPVVLGRGMNPSSPTISPDAQTRAISAIHKFQGFLRKNHQPHHTKFVATSAVREAINQGEFLSRVEQETSVEVEVLSGEEEARLVYNGVLQFLPVYERTVLAVDIGGGSTEFVVGKEGVVLFAVSVKLGHVSLTEKFANCKIGDMRSYIRSVIYESGLVDKVREIGFEVCVGSSGTIRAIEKAVFLGYGQDSMSGVGSYGDFTRKWKFSRKDLSCVVEKLCESGGKEEADVWRDGLFKRRSEFILAGAVLLSEIFEVLGIDDDMEVSEYALGEGVIAETLARCSSADYNINANARWRSVVRLATRFNSDKRMKSATNCADIAGELFVGLKKYDELTNHPNKNVLPWNAKDLEYLEAACLLHNIGLFIGKKGHHKQSYHIIKNGDYLKGYNAEEVELIALLARHHRKKFPKSDHSSLCMLPDEVKGKFRALCSIIRISVAVNHFQSVTFEGLNTSNCPGVFELVLSNSVLKDQTLVEGHVTPTREDVEAELKLELVHFEQVFKKKLSVVVSSNS